MESCQEENDKSLIGFLNSIRKVKESRNHKVKGSYGVYDAYKFIRKNKWFNIGRPLSEHEFYSIVRRVNEYLVESFLQGNDIKLTNKMGRLELRKYEARISFNGNKIRTNLPIDWDRTLKLWYEDEEAYKNKTLIKVEEKEIFKVYYNRQLADFNNKTFYEFNINRDVKRRLKQRIKEGIIDAFNI